MPSEQRFLTHDDWLAQGMFYRDKAVELLENPEVTAEEVQEAERFKAMADEAFGNSEMLRTLKGAPGAVRQEPEPTDEGDNGQRRSKPTGFVDLGEFLFSTYKSRVTGRMDERLKDLIFVPDDGEVKETERLKAGGHTKKDLVEAVGASGGFLVPTEFLAQLMAISPERNIIRSRATVIRMRRRAINIPVLDQTGTASGRSNFFGGMCFYWAEEAAYKDMTEPEFRQIELVAHKLIGYTRASDELLDDAAISLNDFFNSPLGFVGGVSWEEDYAFLRGTGVGMPLGIVPAPATITVPRAVAGTIGYTDLLGMLQSFLPGANGVWVATQSALAALAQISGPAGNPSYVWLNDASGGIPGRLLGFPIVFTEKLNLMGGDGDILLIDPAYYLIGDRQATTVEVTKFDRWRYDETSWRCVHRVDGQPWMSAPLTLADGTSQISPFVKLGVGGS